MIGTNDRSFISRGIQSDLQWDLDWLGLSHNVKTGLRYHEDRIKRFHTEDAFDMLYKEGETQPKMMSVGLHLRLVGHPARAAALERFLDYVLSFPDVWITRRIDIANHWQSVHPARTLGVGHE